MDYRDQITKLKDTRNVPTREDGTPMVTLDPSLFHIQYLQQDMVPLLGDRMVARQTVADKLANIQQRLNRDGQGVQLHIAYVYRAPEVQQRYFDRAYKKVLAAQPDLPEEERIEKSHSMAADPLVAGHPTGAAVDLTLWNTKTGSAFDMGSGIAEFGDIAYTLYPDLTSEQKKNRLYLQKLMMDEGFAPFLGEWWHFSYGDKEWAFYYKKPNALFDVVPLSAVQ